LRQNQIPEDISLSAQLRIDQGLEIHQRARILYPQGFYIGDRNINTAAEKTTLLINNYAPIIYEASFIVNNYRTKVDILRRVNSGWHLYEIKSSLNLSDELIDDITYTSMVIKRAGLDVKNYSLILLSRDYRLGMSDQDLFVEVDVSSEVSTRINDFDRRWDEIDSIINGANKPEPELKWDCRNCELFKDCVGRDIDNHIFELPRLHRNKFYRLNDMGIISIEDIPDDFDLTDNQEIVRDSVIRNYPIVQSGLRAELDRIVFPAYYLDFETTQTAIPLYTDIAPYTQIPTQYSLHRCSAPGQVDEHYEYLADPSRDSRRELAESLIRDCGEVGSILEYTRFEERIINSLIELFPDLRDELQSLIDRMVDLYDILRRGYYHPQFHGSYSLKDVLPVMVPSLTYEGMNISEGGDALAVFAYMAIGRYSEEEIVVKMRELLEYCRLDTLAMVRVHEELVSSC